MPPVEADIPPLHGKGQLPAADDEPGQRHADCLRQHGSQCRAGRAHAERAHQQQVQPDIEHAGDGHGDQRHAGISHAPEHAADDVIGHDEDKAAGADAYVDHGQIEGRLRCVQQGGYRPRQPHGQGGHQQRQHGKGGDTAADDLPRFPGPSLPYPLPHHDGDAHGHANDDHGDGGHHLRAGGHCGDVRRRGEIAHHPQVHRIVHHLQEKGQQDGKGKADQRAQDGAFGEDDVGLFAF